MMKIWVGLRTDTRHAEVFRHETTPTLKSHGDLYRYVIGPFKTLRGARYMTRAGFNNPHCQRVADAERIAKRLEDEANGKLVN